MTIRIKEALVRVAVHARERSRRAINTARRRGGEGALHRARATAHRKVLTSRVASLSLTSVAVGGNVVHTRSHLDYFQHLFFVFLKWSSEVCCLFKKIKRMIVQLFF